MPFPLYVFTGRSHGRYAKRCHNVIKATTSKGLVYDFTYDAYGDFSLRSSIKIGSRTLANYTYTDRNNYLSSLDYGNGDKVEYTYNEQGRVTKQTYEDGATVEYRYDNTGTLATVTDSATGRMGYQNYDEAGNILYWEYYSYIDGFLGDMVDSGSNSYGDSSWGDLLTKHGDERVFSDEIGNPLRMGPNTFTWEHGRQMASMSVASDCAITKQPEDFVGMVGDTAAFSIEARGTNLTYQWQVSTNGGKQMSTGHLDGFSS